MNTGKYQVILADPPWHYNNRKTSGERCDKTKFGGGAMKHYPLMSDSDLLAMAPMVRAITDNNCALFMWATMPRLDFGLQLLQAWGFRYTTVAFVWVKTQKASGRPVYGPGYYTASNAEVVLLGVIGSMCPARKMLGSIIAHPRMEHSRKPDLHPIIQQMYPEVYKIEMFARRKYPGWDTWGNEALEETQLLLTEEVRHQMV